MLQDHKLIKYEKHPENSTVDLKVNLRYVQKISGLSVPTICFTFNFKERTLQLSLIKASRWCHSDFTNFFSCEENSKRQNLH